MKQKENMKAMQVMTTQTGGYCDPAAARYAEQSAKKRILAVLERYIRVNTVDHIAYVDRHFWFDVEEFSKDLEKFGTEMPKSQIVAWGAEEQK